MLHLIRSLCPVKSKMLRWAYIAAEGKLLQAENLSGEILFREEGR